MAVLAVDRVASLMPDRLSLFADVLNMHDMVWY